MNLPRNTTNVTVTKNTSYFWVDQVQFVDDYRIIAITKLGKQSIQRLLMMWDTTTAKERQLVFGMRTRDILYHPKGFVDYGWTPVGVGVHLSDPARRAVGILCRGNRGNAYEHDNYMIVVNAADMCAHASGESSFLRKSPGRREIVRQR